jgi:hypothetical protein
LFSRKFVRKRATSLATTASVAATSFALAQDPSSSYHVHGVLPVQYATDRPSHPDEQPFLSKKAAAMNKMMEIAAKRLAVGEKMPPSVVSPTQAGLMPPRDIARGAMRRGSMQVDMNAALEIHSRKPGHQELSQWASFVSL